MQRRRLQCKALRQKQDFAIHKNKNYIANEAEFEQTWFLHQFNRNCNNNDLRRDIALIRRHEQHQRKIISSLKPVDETIAYEQLAIDLTAILARHIKDDYVKNALNFALLEDFDHLYRFAARSKN